MGTKFFSNRTQEEIFNSTWKEQKTLIITTADAKTKGATSTGTALTGDTLTGDTLTVGTSTGDTLKPVEPTVQMNKKQKQVKK
jgi:hypothetical protein